MYRLIWPARQSSVRLTNLADANNPDTKSAVLHAAYQDPLTPDDLTDLWPNGPTIGGTGA
jgi:hypothetical protein